MKTVNKDVDKMLRRRLWELFTPNSTSYSRLVHLWKSLDNSMIPASKLAKFEPLVEECLRAAGIGWTFGVCQKTPIPLKAAPCMKKADRFLLRSAQEWGINIGRNQLGLANSWRTHAEAPKGNRPRTAAIVESTIPIEKAAS